MEELPLNEAQIILGWIFSMLFINFKVQGFYGGIDSFFFCTDAKTNVQTLPVSIILILVHNDYD